MKNKTHVKADGMSLQHNQKVASGLKVKTGVKAAATNGDIYVGAKLCRQIISFIERHL